MIRVIKGSCDAKNLPYVGYLLLPPGCLDAWNDEKKSM